MRRSLATILAWLVIGLPALADDAIAPKGPAETGYALQPATGDYLKIDPKTGDVSLCAQKNGVWSCQLIPEDRLAYEERIGDLEADNAALQRQLASLTARLDAAGAGSAFLDQEDERRLRQALEFGERMLHHFLDTVGAMRDKTEHPI